MLHGMTETDASSRERLWRGRVGAWEASGLSAPRYAAGKGFSGSSLLYWRRRLRETAAPPSPKPAASRPSFAQVVARGTMPAGAGGLGAGIVVEVSGVSIRVGREFDAGLLSEVVRALREGSG
jgi:hypothetical protein